MPDIITALIAGYAIDLLLGDPELYQETVPEGSGIVPFPFNSGNIRHLCLQLKVFLFGFFPFFPQDPEMIGLFGKLGKRERICSAVLWENEDGAGITDR